MVSFRAVLAVLFSTVGVSGQNNKTESACFGVNGCSMMTLDCQPDGHLFVMKMQYGYKPSNGACPSTKVCGDCCRPGPSDCFSDYTDANFGAVYVNNRCWHSRNCTTPALWSANGCPKYRNTSTFAEIYYVCLKSYQITAFNLNTTITAPAVAVHYNTSNRAGYNVTGDNQTWHCWVDTADCVQRQTDVILVKEKYTGSNSNNCSSVGWSGGPFLPCVPEFQYERFTTLTPFRVSVWVERSRRRPNGWAVVRCKKLDKTQNEKDLVVTCGYMDDNPPASSSCPDEMMPSTTSYPGSSEDEPATATAPNTGAVVGGVVAAVSVLVAVVLAVICYTRRLRLTSDAKAKTSDRPKTTTCLPMVLRSGSSAPSLAAGPNASDALDKDNLGVCNPALQNASGRIADGKKSSVVDNENANFKEGPKSRNGKAVAFGLHGNVKSPVEDPDYDRLGGKKPQSSSSNPAATYGRLGEVGGGGEDTDYSYDHLARGRQAAPDVIDSDYDTSALHLTSEGDYNVAAFQKRKQHDLTASDYDTAEIVTPEGDYNRVDFQRRKKNVINGSDYDVAEVVISDNTE